MSSRTEFSKIEAILNSAVTAIITIDTGGVIESANPATERLFGFKATEMIGRNVRMLMPEPYLGRRMASPPTSCANTP